MLFTVYNRIVLNVNTTRQAHQRTTIENIVNTGTGSFFIICSLQLGSGNSDLLCSGFCRASSRHIFFACVLENLSHLAPMTKALGVVTDSLGFASRKYAHIFLALNVHIFIECLGRSWRQRAPISGK